MRESILDRAKRARKLWSPVKIWIRGQFELAVGRLFARACNDRLKLEVQRRLPTPATAVLFGTTARDTHQQV